MERPGRYIPARLLVIAALTAAPLACEAPPSAVVCEQQPDQLALDPVYVTLGIQETIRLDDELAATIASVLDRARTVEPHLSRIHTRPPWWPERLYLWAQRPEVTNAWGNGAVTTGVAEVDFLLTEYFASNVEPSGDRPDEYVVHFAEPLNAPRLLEQFSEIDGITGSVIWMYGDSDTIEVVRETDGWRVTFTLGWGDCLAGCIYHYRWEVLVPDGNEDVVLVREGGDSADWWFMDCVPVLSTVPRYGADATWSTAGGPGSRPVRIDE